MQFTEMKTDSYVGCKKLAPFFGIWIDSQVWHGLKTILQTSVYAQCNYNRTRIACVADHAYKQFYGDEFLRLLILRFVFCFITLRYHRGFKVRIKDKRGAPDHWGSPAQTVQPKNLGHWAVFYLIRGMVQSGIGKGVRSGRERGTFLSVGVFLYGPRLILIVVKWYTLIYTN